MFVSELLWYVLYVLYQLLISKNLQVHIIVNSTQIVLGSWLGQAEAAVALRRRQVLLEYLLGLI